MPKDLIVIKAKSINEALQKAAQEFKVEIQDVSYKILKKPSVFSKSGYEIEAWKAPFLDTILGHPSASPRPPKNEKETASLGSRDLEEENTSDLRSKARVIVKKNGIFIRLDVNIAYTEEMIRDLLFQRGVLKETQDKIPEILKSEPTSLLKIAPFTGKLAEMSPLVLNVSKDELQAYLVMKSPRAVGGPTVSFEEVMDFLKKQNIQEHLQFDNIKLLVEEEILNTPVLVADATAPAILLHSSSIYTKHYLPEIISSTENEDSQLSVDHKGHTSKYRSFKKGEVICERSGENQPSKVSKNIFGNPFQLEGELETVIFLKAGKGVREEGNGKVFYADMDGFVVEAENSLKILPFLSISGSIGYATGNIFVEGDVVIGGDIQAGFRVKSTGNVTVEGFVQKGNVVSDGNLEVKKGIIGAEINIKGSLIAYYIEISKLYVLGNIICYQEISSSYTYCSGYVLLHGSKGYIVGGEMIVKKGVMAKKIGSLFQGISLSIGVDPIILEIHKQLLQERESIVEGLRKREFDLERVQKSAAIKLQNMEEVQKGLISNVQEGKNLLEKIGKELAKVESYLEAQKKFGFLTIRGTLYPGVRLNLNGLSILFGEKITNKTIRTQNSRWKIDAVDTTILEKKLLDLYNPKTKKA